MEGCQKSVVFAIIFATSVYSQGYLPPKKTTVPCINDAECVTLPFTFCADNTAYNPGVCSCTKEYVLREENNKFDCLEEAKFFNDPCQIDDQCKPKFGEAAACIQNKCKCSPTAHFVNLKCWISSRLGETCGDPNNCIATQNSTCNGICSCVPGYIGNPAKTKCLKVAQNLGEPCEDTVQCTSANPIAACQHSVCLCPPLHTQSGNTCTKSNQQQKYNSATGVRESVTMLLIALFIFCVKI